MHAVSFGKLRVPGYCHSIIIYCPLQTPALKENSILQKVHSPRDNSAHKLSLEAAVCGLLDDHIILSF